MNRKKFANILMGIGIALFFFGLGWFFGRTFGTIGIELWKVLLMVMGIILMLISLFPKR